MASLKDLMVNGVARIIGKIYSSNGITSNGSIEVKNSSSTTTASIDTNGNINCSSLKIGDYEIGIN